MVVLVALTVFLMIYYLWRYLRTAAWGRLCGWRSFPAAGAVLLCGATAPFEQWQRGRGMPEEKLRFDAIIGLPDGQCWVLRYRGPAWRVAGNSGMERMTNQIASGRVLLQTLLELCAIIPGLSVRVVQDGGHQEDQGRMDG